MARKKVTTDNQYAEQPTGDKPQQASSGSQKKEKFPGAPAHSVLLAWLQFGKSAAQKTHWNYFVIDQFLKGNHNVRGNPNDNTIEIRGKTDSINYPINKIFSTFRAVRAFVTRNKPVAEIEPDNSSDQSKTSARRYNLVLERDNKLNNGRKLNKEWVYYGIKYGVGWRQIGYDVDKKCAIRWTIDPFDLLIGSKTGEAEDAPYLIKCLVRTVGYWKERYPDCGVVADNLTAEDEYKRIAIEMEFQNTAGNAQPEAEQTAVGYECWYRTFKKNSKGGYVNKCLFTKTTIVDFEETPYTEYPFIPYKSEVTPNQVTADGHLKHIIAPQRMLNLLNTQMLEHNHITNRGTIIMEKNAGLKVINAREGRIIQKNQGKYLQFVTPPSLSQIIQWQTTFANQAIEDIGGQHDASAGITPARVSSGDAIEALQQGDSNNISDLRDNFEDALALEAAWILKMYSYYESNGLPMSETVDGKTQDFMVLGAQAYKTMGVEMPANYMNNGSYLDVVAILPENQVKVSINSQLGETAAARLALVKELVGLGLPLKFLLEFLEFPNTTDIFERIASEGLADMMMEKMQLGGGAGGPVAPGGPVPAGAPMPGAMPPAGGPPHDNAQLAMIKELQDLRDKIHQKINKRNGSTK